MGYSITNLTLNRKNDLVAILGYFLGLQVKPNSRFKPNAFILKTLTATIEKVRQAEVGKRFDLESHEFGATYTAAQYMMHGITADEGAAYMNAVFGDRRTAEWKKEMVEYFRDTCMYYVNECNNRYAEIPEFIMLRTQVEKQILKDAGR